MPAGVRTALSRGIALPRLRPLVGEGFERINKFDLAAQWYGKAADRGHPAARKLLATIYVPLPPPRGDGFVFPREKQSPFWLPFIASLIY